MALFDRRLIIALGLGLALAACGSGGGTATSDGDMTLGDPGAPVTMIEYASLSCPHCAQWNEDVFPAVKEKYIDTGRVHYVFREFLTAPVEVASAGFLMARCAGDDKYFSVMDAVFRAQTVMFQTGDYRGELLRIAKSAGLSEAEFNACIRDEDALKALNARVEKAVRQDKINATPTFIINGEKIEGEATIEKLDAAITKAEAAAK